MVYKRFSQTRPDVSARAPRTPRAALVLLLLGLGAAAAPQFAGAHHSVSQFDGTQEVDITGTVAKLEWANPHVWIRVNVVDDAGEEVTWGVEASNPLDLGRKGWSKKTFQPGDNVTITIHPARNGKPYGAFVRAEMPDGNVLEGP